MSYFFAALGLLCLLYCAGIAISGAFGSFFFLIWGALGGISLLAGWIVEKGLWGALPAALRVGVLAVFAVCLLVFLGIEGLIVSHFGLEGRDNLDYLVVLGAQMWKSGPGTTLRLRLDTAYEYLMKNEDTVVIVSGGQGSNEPVSEAQGMYDYLVGRGIPADRIRMEDKSVNTCENLQFSRKLMEKENPSVGIVTNNFHVFRSTRLAVAQGYGEVYGISAPAHPFMQPNNMLREFFGVMKDWLFGNMKLWGK